MPSGFSVSGSPVTSTGTLAVTTSLSGIIKGNGSGLLAATAKTDYWDTTVFVASGASHAIGLVPDPGVTSGTTKFLREDATWQVPAGGGGGGGTWTEVEIDFGSTKPQYDAQFTITDAGVSSSSKLIVLESGKAATGRVLGDSQWDSIGLSANPGAGNFVVYAVANPGPVKGKRKIQYQIAA